MRHPEALSHFEKPGGRAFFVTETGTVGAAFRLPLIDLEGLQARNQLWCIEKLTKALEPGIRLRVLSQHALEEVPSFPGLVGVRHEVILVFERDPVGFAVRAKNLIGRTLASLSKLLPEDVLRELEASELSEEEVRALFLPRPLDLERKGRTVLAGPSVLGVVRLFRPGTTEWTEKSLPQVLDTVPLPFRISVSVTKSSKTRTEWRLRSRHSKLASESFDPLSAQKRAETEEALETASLGDGELCDVEWLMVLERESEERLRSDLATAAQALRRLGDPIVETFGTYPSFLASLPGSKPHNVFSEFHSNLVAVLPVANHGEDSKLEPVGAVRSLPLYRRNGSIHAFDTLSSDFLAFNTLITGKTGSGKSVLANALSHALFSDPAIQLVKIDVGGSYKKECELFGGDEVNFALNRPTGVNPFTYLGSETRANEAVEVLTEFVCTLLKEEGERFVPRSLASEISQTLKNYQREARDYSLDNFVASTPEFPRKKLLSRWCSGGVYENAFRGRKTEEPANRYRYFNFESIQSASNADYAEGVMAAVIAMLNLEMFRLSENTTGPTRLVLFCDETKFFIERNSDFFLLTTANFRKFGHAVVLIAQNIRNFEIPRGQGRTDSGIILNSPTRFFLEQDVERAFLKEHFGLNDEELSVVVDSPYRGKDYREFVLQDDTGTRIVRLKLSPEEYWRVTSTRSDNDKLSRLRAAVPGLTLEEAIRCLARA
jgi:type IV secretory pathway VirB4 component